ncbi:hypothetical protein Tco_0091481 [Tanacetum coccineum]
MRVFPFSLTGAARKWWEDESIGSATKRGDDEEVICGNEVSKDENLTEENEFAQIFRIDTNLFHFETPLCQAFKEFNYLSQMDVDIYERNNRVPWVEEKPWTSNEEWAKPIKDEYGDLPGLIHEGNLIHYEDYEWYDTIEESELKVEALNNKRMLEELMNEKEESSDNGQGLDSPIDEWDDYEHAANIETDVDSNYNPYLDIFDYLMIIRLRMKARLFNMRSS